MVKSTPRSADTAGYILDATERLRTEGGLAAINVKRVAELAGVGVGTLYHHFASREDLIKACEQRAWAREFAALMGRLGVPHRDAMHTYIRDLVAGAIDSAVRRIDSDGFSMDIPEMRHMAFGFYDQTAAVLVQLTQTLQLPVRSKNPSTSIILAIETVAMLAWMAALRHRDLLATGELQREVADIAVRYLLQDEPAK